MTDPARNQPANPLVALSGALGQFAHVAGMVVKDSLPALKKLQKFAPLMIAEPEAGIFVVGAVVLGSALGHGANHIAKQQQTKQQQQNSHRRPGV